MYETKYMQVATSLCNAPLANAPFSKLLLLECLRGQTSCMPVKVASSSTSCLVGFWAKQWGWHPSTRSCPNIGFWGYASALHPHKALDVSYIHHPAPVRNFSSSCNQKLAEGGIGKGVYRMCIKLSRNLLANCEKLATISCNLPLMHETKHMQFCETWRAILRKFGAQFATSLRITPLANIPFSKFRWKAILSFKEHRAKNLVVDIICVAKCATVIHHTTS